MKKLIGIFGIIFFVFISLNIVYSVNLPQLDEKLISVSANPTYTESYIYFSPDYKVCITNVTVFGGGLGETQMRELYFNSSVEIKIGTEVYYRSKSNFTFGQYKTDNDGSWNDYKLTYDFENCVPLNVSTTYSLEMINAVALNGFRRGGNAPVSNNWNITSSSNTDIYVWFFGNYWENYTCPSTWSNTTSSCDITDLYTIGYDYTNNCCADIGYGGDCNLPSNTTSGCNYCTVSYTETSHNCLKSYTLNNYLSCCAVTSIPADCNVPANITDCVGVHSTSDISSVVIDFIVEYGLQMILFAGLLAIIGIGIWILNVI